MKRFLVLAIAALTVGAMTAADIAEAKRLGGGRSFGAQRSAPNAAAPSAPSAAPATPPGAAANPVMPGQPGANAARPSTPAAAGAGAAAAPARSGMSRWLAPIAGLAAGLGLAALLSHFGLSESFATFLLLALIVLAGVFVLRRLFGRRTITPAPLQYAGGVSTATTAPKGYETQVPPSSGGPRIEPAFGRASAPAVSKYPPGFDPAPFLAQARQQFTRLQTSYDLADRAALADVLTPEVYAEIVHELDARGSQERTEVVALDAEILDVTTEGNRHWASVRFHGTMREDGAVQPQPFDEVWNLVKPVDGSSGWLLAGIRQLAPAQ